MASGHPLVIFMDKVAGNFYSDYFDPNYLPEEIFNPTKIVEEDIHMKCVREDENNDYIGGKGNFVMRDGFKVVVVSTRDINDEDNSQFGERMPLDHMEYFVIS